MSKVAFCFPGQGALEAGMGRELAEAVPAAMEVYRIGSEASGLDLQKLCFDSPLEDLVHTEVQQPALVATCLAILAAIRAAGIEPDVVVGHSVGEFAALAAAVALGTGEAIGLVRERGLAMAEAARRHPGSMAAILGLEDEAVETLCRKIVGVWPANYNCPGQIVISGENDAVEESARRGREPRRPKSHQAEGLRCIPQPSGRAGRRPPQAGDRHDPVPRPDRAVHVHRDCSCGTCNPPRVAARRPADGAGEVHPGRSRARPRRRHDVRRGRARGTCSPGSSSASTRAFARSRSTTSPASREHGRRSRRERASARSRARPLSSPVPRVGSAGDRGGARRSGRGRRRRLSDGPPRGGRGGRADRRSCRSGRRLRPRIRPARSSRRQAISTSSSTTRASPATASWRA